MTGAARPLVCLAVPHSSRRSAGAFLCASLALAAALALSAPLVHAHLAGNTAQGLCGEHHPDSSPAPTSDACSLCLAGAHAPAMREPGAPLWDVPASPAAPAATAPEADLGVPRSRPGTPRAPPLPA